MNVIDPEMPIIDEVFGCMAQLCLDVVADKGGGTVTGGITGVNDRRVGCQDVLQPLLGLAQLLFFAVALGDIANGTDEFIATVGNKSTGTDFRWKSNAIFLDQIA